MDSVSNTGWIIVGPPDAEVRERVGGQVRSRGLTVY
jgi:hypothetical protein